MDRQLEAMLPPGDGFHLFGYGSLMWRPGFPYAEVRPARVFGFHRALCVWSWVHRGTRRQPGLVFGLEVGGSCVGRLYSVAPAARKRTLRYLRQRELPTTAYLAKVVPVHHDDGRGAALVFVTNRDDAQYAPRLSPELAASVVQKARGDSGANRDYVLNTQQHLRELGIRDAGIDRICELLRAAGHSTTAVASV